MFLHVGGDLVVPTSDIIAIIDANLAEISAITKEFMQMARGGKGLVDISNGNPKSFVLTSDQMILSPISSVTLQKRGNFLSELEKEGFR